MYNIVCHWIAVHLPRRVVYWCVLRYLVVSRRALVDTRDLELWVTDPKKHKGET